jgi:hypothetical protein
MRAPVRISRGEETGREMQIRPGTSAEAAIKIAYDFARGLRRSGARDHELEQELFAFVDTPHRNSPLLRYIRAGFAAGYRGTALPWVREIDALEPFVRVATEPGLASASR